MKTHFLRFFILGVNVFYIYDSNWHITMIIRIVQTDDHKLIVTGVEFNCTAVTQGAISPTSNVTNATTA